MPSLRRWDSACRLSVSVQSQDSSWSPEMYLGHSKDTHWMSYLQPLSVRHPLPYWTGNTPLAELDHLPLPCRRPFVNNPQNIKDRSGRRPKHVAQTSQTDEDWPFSSLVTLLMWLLSKCRFSLPLFSLTSTQTAPNQLQLENAEIFIGWKWLTIPLAIFEISQGYP